MRAEEAAELAMWAPSLRQFVWSVAHRARDMRADERVTLDLGLSRVRAGLCYACGGLIEPALLELGSPRCLDCGDTQRDARAMQ
jgi:hypothetical protein